MKYSPAQLWQQSLQLIKGNVTEQQYETWFKPIVFESYSPATMTILVQVPSPFVYEYLEENFVDLIGKALKRFFGQNVRLTYRVITDKTGKLIAIKNVTENNDLMIIEKSGRTIRMAVTDIRVAGRATQGVKLINIKDGDSIAAVSTVEKNNEEETVNNTEEDNNN